MNMIISDNSISSMFKSFSFQWIHKVPDYIKQGSPRISNPFINLHIGFFQYGQVLGEHVL